MKRQDKILYENKSVCQGKSCLFLDRDGVIIQDVHYIKEPQSVVLHEGAKELFAECSRLKYPVVVVTNQSGISRGILDWHNYMQVTERMVNLLGRPASLVAIYANANNPNIAPNEHDWRKPGAGMLTTASTDLGICLEKSIMVGDRLSDLLAGANAGVKAVVHLLTGHGLNERDSVANHIDNNRTLKGARNKPEVILSKSIKDVIRTYLRVIR